MFSENPSGADNQQETAEPCVVLEAKLVKKAVFLSFAEVV